MLKISNFWVKWTFRKFYCQLFLDSKLFYSQYYILINKITSPGLTDSLENRFFEAFLKSEKMLTHSIISQWFEFFLHPIWKISLKIEIKRYMAYSSSRVRLWGFEFDPIVFNTPRMIWFWYGVIISTEEYSRLLIIEIIGFKLADLVRKFES